MSRPLKMKMPKKAFLCVVLTCLAPLWLSAAHAQETATEAAGFSEPVDPGASVPTYKIELKDGALLPETLVVPAKTRFKLHVTNIGTKPSEFESNQMRLEEVLFMGMDVTMTVTPLDSGEYDYFDEFQPGVMGKLIAKEVAQ
ncbi:cupredoxin domain-containing protein [uncultured Thioclava sp.]|uniref:cupredoxin domain-containing protein n=1 Tax=uncultured Thioclava sp. TaxID=473858 RepID=UPI0025CC6AE7|nr:cupredoxin domain-containing protein [uncultured Thioclava sp.]